VVIMYIISKGSRYKKTNPVNIITTYLVSSQFQNYFLRKATKRGLYTYIYLNIYTANGNYK